MVYGYVENITTMFRSRMSMKVAPCATAILADVSLSRYMWPTLVSFVVH